MLQRVMSQIAAVKKDMIILEKSEFSTLLAENEVSDSKLVAVVLIDMALFHCFFHLLET